MRRLLTALPLLLALTALPAHAADFVRYSPAEGEYSLLLPEAPQAETIRSDGRKDVPLLRRLQPVGTVGEHATFKRVDSDTGDSISVSITTVKAPLSFLEELTEASITLELENMYRDVTLDRQKNSYSAGSKTLKWGTISGYNVDQNNRLYFNIAHYLVGIETVSVIQISFSVENRRYKQYYAEIAPSIAYTGN